MGTLPINEAAGDILFSVEDSQLVLRLKTQAGGEGNSQPIEEIVKSLVQNPDFIQALVQRLSYSESLVGAIVESISSKQELINKLVEAIAGKGTTIDRILEGLDQEQLSQSTHQKLLMNTSFVDKLKKDLSGLLSNSDEVVNSLAGSLKDNVKFLSKLHELTSNDSNLLDAIADRVAGKKTTIDRILEGLDDNGNVVKALSKHDLLKRDLARILSEEDSMKQYVASRATLSLINDGSFIKEVTRGVSTETLKQDLTDLIKPSVKDRILKELKDDAIYTSNIKEDLKEFFSKNGEWREDLIKTMAGNTDFVHAFVSDAKRSGIQYAVARELRDSEELKGYLASALKNSSDVKQATIEKIMEDADFRDSVAVAMSSKTSLIDRLKGDTLEKLANDSAFASTVSNRLRATDTFSASVKQVLMGLNVKSVLEELAQNQGS